MFLLTYESYAYKDGTCLLTGDMEGILKLWDVRKTDGCVWSQQVDTCKPISNITTNKQFVQDEEGKYLAVNCYDDSNYYLFFFLHVC